ncbi:MAG: nucleotidyltransferase family protein [Tepidisphaeraceae bacterium]
MSDELPIYILAAGASTRLGRPKQLVTIAGEPLLRRQCRIALDAALGPVTVVLGCHAESCAATITDLPVCTLLSTDWVEGLAASLRVATRDAQDRQAPALLVLQCDQFRITADDLRLLYRAWTHSGNAVRAVHDAYRGPPVMLPEACFAGMLELHGDQGARGVLAKLDPARVAEVACPNAIFDLDLPEHLALLDATRQ